MSRRHTGPWFIYGLVDPRTDEVFYVGCSVCPEDRLKCHRSDVLSAARPRILDLLGLGLKAGIRVFSEHTEFWRARNAEDTLIATLPGLTNLDRPGGTRIYGCAPGTRTTLANILAQRESEAISAAADAVARRRYLDEKYGVPRALERIAGHLENRGNLE